MEVRADPSRLLMSDSLRGTVPRLEEDDEGPGDGFVVTAEGQARLPGGRELRLVGAVRSVLFDRAEPEVELRVPLTDALDVAEGIGGVTFDGFTIQRQERSVEVAGPLSVRAARISEVDADADPRTQTCVLALALRRGEQA